MKKILLLLIMVIVLPLNAQKRTADKFYEKGDYINAAKYYEKYLKRYPGTKDVIKNISDAYYKTYQFKNAEYHMRKLINGNFQEENKKYENSFNFKMYHIQTILGDFEKATNYLSLYYQNKNVVFNKKRAIKNIEKLKLKNNDYKTTLLTISRNNSEFGAYKMGDSIFFVSDRNSNPFAKSYQWTHKPFLNIYQAKLINNQVLNSSIKELPETINSKLHEGNFCFSKDNNTIYFSRSNITDNKKKFNDNKVNTIQIFKSEKINGKWKTAEKLHFCKDNFSYQHPSFDYNENKLYFSSNENNNKEDFDIFYVDIINNEKYGKPVNLGKTINTEELEQFPFIDKNGNLFFSSNGHLGLGMLDVFVAEKSGNKFLKPINLGAPINSKYDDFSLVYANNKTGYFSSNRNLLNDDIYSFEQIGDVLSEEYLVNFEVKDLISKKLIKNSNVSITNFKKNIIYSNKSNSFIINIPADKYYFSAKAQGYFDNTITINSKENENQKFTIFLNKKPEITKIETKPLKEKQVKVVVNNKIKQNPHPKKTTQIILEKKGVISKDNSKKELLEDRKGPKIIIKNNQMYFDMPPILFEFDKWTLTKGSKKVLDELAEKLERHKNVYIKISSHTDKRGTDRYNQFLSEKRAESTRNYLALVGYVNARRMEFKGYGESLPVIDCDKCTEEEHKLNRRSEFKIIKY